MISGDKKSHGLTLALLVSMALWGGSWISAKLLSGLDPMVIATLRLLMTGISFIPILLLRRESFPVGSKFLVWTFVSAMALLFYNYLFFSGLALGAAGQAGILVTTTNPLWAFFLAFLFQRRKVHLQEVSALMLGLAGGLLQILLPLLDGSGMSAGQAALFFLAAGVYAFMTLAGQKAQSGVGPLMFSALVHSLAGLGALVFVLANNATILVETIETADFMFWGNILYMALGAGTLATTVYFFSARKVGSALTSIFTFTVPFWALILSWIILAETPKWYSILGGLLALTAVWLLQQGKKYTPKDAR